MSNVVPKPLGSKRDVLSQSMKFDPADKARNKTSLEMIDLGVPIKVEKFTGERPRSAGDDESNKNDIIKRE